MSFNECKNLCPDSRLLGLENKEEYGCFTFLSALEDAMLYKVPLIFTLFVR